MADEPKPKRGADRISGDMRRAKTVPQDPENPEGITDIPTPSFIDDKDAPPAAPEAPAERPLTPKPPPKAPVPVTKAAPEAPPPAPPAKKESVATDDRLERMAQRLHEQVFKDADAPVRAVLTPEVKKKLNDLRLAGENEAADDLLVEETNKATQSGVIMSQKRRDELKSAFDARVKAQNALFAKHPEVLDYEEAVAEGKDVSAYTPTPFQKVLWQVFKDKPEYERAPMGPKHAMEEAERILELEELRAERDGRAAKDAAEPSRAARAAAASALAGGGAPQAPSAPVVSLSEDHRLVAAVLRMPEEKLARRMMIRKQAGSRGFKIGPADTYEKSRKLPARIR